MKNIVKYQELAAQFAEKQIETIQEVVRSKATNQLLGNAIKGIKSDMEYLIEIQSNVTGEPIEPEEDLEEEEQPEGEDEIALEDQAEEEEQEMVEGEGAEEYD